MDGAGHTQRGLISEKYIPNFALIRRIMLNCNLCNQPLTEKIYESTNAKSLTSLCTVYEGATQVYFCHQCGHVQSIEIDNIDEYYDHDYDILVESEEEDQVYEVIDGKVVYRTEHQVETLLHKIPLVPNTKILDYGCAKSSTMRALVNKNPNLQVHLFDVSDRYIPFWKSFLSEQQWATYRMSPTWDGLFDVVTSFFSLEHMAHPQDALRQISRVLKTNGIFYGIVPHLFTNTADMIVVDHVNHFTNVSLRYLLENSGFEVLEIDETAHRGTLIFTAKKIAMPLVDEQLPSVTAISQVFTTTLNVAQFWQNIGTKIKDFEQSVQKTERVVVYGAGFYGAFITSCLQHPEKIAYIVDQNSFLKGRKINGVEVISPIDLPQDIRVILVGLNPTHAQKYIEEVREFQQRPFTYLFL
jgi:ubiquinone/menaquinone biosynthesis C-methylase UbiE